MSSVLIKKGPTDPVCARASIGGNDKIGFYCVYRGPREHAIQAIEAALKAMREFDHEPPIDPTVNPLAPR